MAGSVFAKPTLVLTSHGDDVLRHAETIDGLARIVPDSHLTLIELMHARHDVTLAMEVEDKETVLRLIGAWLDGL